MLIYLLGVHSWYTLAHLWPSWDFSPHQIRKQCREQNSWAGNHWLCLHRRNRKMPTQCNLLELKVIPDLTALHSRGEAQEPKPKHRSPMEAHTCRTSCVSLSTWCHHKTWAVLAPEGWEQTITSSFSHLYRPVLSCPLQCFIFLTELCPSHGNIVSHSSSRCHWGQLSAHRFPKESKNPF